MVTKAKKTEEVKAVKPARYIEARGSRKTAVARVRLFVDKKGVATVNGRPVEQYFMTDRQRMAAKSPVATMNLTDSVSFTAKVSGGGLTAQSEAVRHGLSRALVKFNEDFRKRLRKSGFLTRDAREVERKKPGLKKARKSPQWQKR
jgi:small subunit ribosomal protein S9